MTNPFRSLAWALYGRRRYVAAALARLEGATIPRPMWNVYRAVFLFVVVVAISHGGPIRMANEALFNGSVISGPGLLLDHPELYTFAPAGAPKPDYSQCGQRGFISTLEDGSPDPNATPFFMQINTPCASPAGDAPSIKGVEDPHTNSEVPEAGSGCLVFLGAVALALRRSR